MRVITTTVTVDLDGVRHLRLYHWREAMKLRAYEQSKEDPRIKMRAERKIGFHLKQVVLLNDFFPMGDTAEQDAQKYPIPKR